MKTDSFFTKAETDKLETHNMLWYDPSDAAQKDKIIKAGNAYYHKYKKAPTRCQVHPAQYDKTVTVPGMKIEASASIDVNHLWIGRAEK